MRKPNKKGCVPTEDVCMQHESPLICRHGCEEAIKHKCAELADADVNSVLPPKEKDI